jgi:hypothetical protein
LNSLLLIEVVLPTQNMGLWIDNGGKGASRWWGTAWKAFGRVFDVIVHRISKNLGWTDKNRGASWWRVPLGELKNIFPYSFPFSTLWLIKAPINLEFGCRMDIGCFGSLTRK